ncbi:polysaccharide deacetylase family protein [Hymenobacter terrenus]|uniref:polysaccharide deacetylase family protein n=1 Tax=Hymenobacter terrenus TaxID=1629124 RepID=UPI0018CF1DA5|nr:polysaccharide deacetylase family protein [Hymenobacter terrenus]
MYHRIAALQSDIWNITVHPDEFEQHIQILSKQATVVPTEELVAALERKEIKRNTIAITFDDGYADNFLVAKPILDHYKLPATFFIASQNIGREEEFWWDELENIFLFCDYLPSVFTSTIAGETITFDLGNESRLSHDLKQQHQRWDACEHEPPTRRCALFLQLWQRLKPLPHAEQQIQLAHIRQWANIDPSTRPEFRSMSGAQLQSLGDSNLHSIGVHTISHPALAHHPKEFQWQELLDNQAFLTNAVGKPINLVAYPYGNYNHETMEVVDQAGFKGAFTTEATGVKNTSHKHRLGRFQVPNLSKQAFEVQLSKWQRTR